MIASRIVLIPVIAGISYGAAPVRRTAPREPAHPLVFQPDLGPEDHHRSSHRRHARGRDPSAWSRPSRGRRGAARGRHPDRSQPAHDGGERARRSRPEPWPTGSWIRSCRSSWSNTSMSRPSSRRRGLSGHGRAAEARPGAGAPGAGGLVVPTLEADPRGACRRPGMRDAEHDDEMQAWPARRSPASRPPRRRARGPDRPPAAARSRTTTGTHPEIRAGAGGDEAALSPVTWLRMYFRFTPTGTRPPPSDEPPRDGDRGREGGGRRDLGGGEGAFSRAPSSRAGPTRPARARHRSSGRIHTSTATVVVLPEAEEPTLSIDEDRDLGSR